MSALIKPVKIFNSISTRVAAQSTAVMTVLGAAVTIAVFAPHQELLSDKEVEKLGAIAEEQHNVVVDTIQRLREDAQFLAGTPPIAGIARARQAGGLDPINGDSEMVWRERLEIIFSSFIKRRPEYSQVRLIGFADGARELVRIDRAAANLFLPITGEDLQRKGDATYVTASAELAPGSVYLSEINLNREYDHVTLPRTPVIRAATPVFGLDGVPYGLLVINQDLTNLFDGLERGRPAGGGLYLTNNRGDYLINTESRTAFGFDLGRPRRIQEDLPEVQRFYSDEALYHRALFDFQRHDQSTVRDYALSMTKIQFDPSNKDRFLALGLSSSYDSLLSESRSVGRWSAFAAAALVLLGAIAIFGYVRRTLHPLSLVSASTQKVAAGDYNVELPTESDDEIGQLSRSFVVMAQGVKERNETLRKRNEEIEQQQMILQAKNTELEEAHQQVESKAVELEQAGQYRSEFLARMSHDLRTPLNSMLILARSLAENHEGNLSDTQLESAEVLLESGTDLLALTNDLLDLSKIEAGKLEIVFGKADLRSLFLRIQKQFEPMALGKSIELRLDLAGDLPPMLRTDPRRVRQILWNLISNAVKYTDHGSVTVAAGLCAQSERPSGGTGEYVSISVNDTGPGIPTEQLDRIFAPYRQLEREVRAGQGGTGLGLAIASELTAALGGELRVQSIVGTGSRFEVVLPMAEHAVEAESGHSSSALPSEGRPTELPSSPIGPTLAAAPHGRSRRILLADDDEGTRWTLERLFRAENADIVLDEAETGSQAVQAIRDHAYDGVILDLFLPEMNGWEVLESLAQDPPPTKPRIILYTGMELTEREQQEASRHSAIVAVKDGALDSTRQMVRLALGESDHGSIAGCRLLLVEDDAASKFALGRELRRFGAEVEEAQDGLDALRVLGDRRDIDAVLMDIRMPVMDGYEAMRRIRSNQTHQSLPVLALTADVTSTDRERCMKAGATAFIRKPIEPAALVCTLKTHIKMAC